jgi:hypothetical protein
MPSQPSPAPWAQRINRQVPLEYTTFQVCLYLYLRSDAERRAAIEEHLPEAAREAAVLAAIWSTDRRN